MSKGRNCDNCECYLEEKDFESYGSWNYTCPYCGFEYIHSSSLSVIEQVKRFLKNN